MKTNKQIFGTTEWASSNKNFINGCSNNCKYCYARSMAIRFKRKTTDNWQEEIVNIKNLNQKAKKENGRIMFPSSHDITPVNLHKSIFFLRELLSVGNQMLIVSKPHFEVIEAICDTFPDYKENILFRFTIGSKDSSILKFWEPDAPNYEERKKCLMYAFNKGFATSVSCEPMLDNNTIELVKDLEPYITDAIWIGKVNRLAHSLKINGYTDIETKERANELLSFQLDNNIWKLYNQLSDNPKIKWKESIKKVVGIEISTIKGADK